MEAEVPIPHEIPRVQTARSFPELLREMLLLIKTWAPKDVFLQVMGRIGIKSRTTFNLILKGKRRFPPTRLKGLTPALDLSFNESNLVGELIANRNRIPEAPSPRLRYSAGPAEVLSNPLNTIVLELCSLGQPIRTTDLARVLSTIFQEEEILEAAKILLKNDLIRETRNGLTRVAGVYQLSAPQGVKLSFAKEYIRRSLQLAEQNYELPLELREYAAFTAKIRQEDFLRLKDLLRDLRRSIYDLSDSDKCDSVVQVNLNAFLVASMAKSASSLPCADV